jgi:hypothetical protein
MYNNHRKIDSVIHFNKLNTLFQKANNIDLMRINCVQVHEYLMPNNDFKKKKYFSIPPKIIKYHPLVNIIKEMH